MSEGFSAEAIVGVDPTAEPRPVGFGGGPLPPMRKRSEGVGGSTRRSQDRA